MCTVQKLFEGGVYFIQLEPEIQCENNSWAGRIQGNTVHVHNEALQCKSLGALERSDAFRASKLLAG